MSRKDVDVLVSAAGWIGSFVGELIPALRKVGISNADIHAYVKAEGKPSIDKVAAVLAEDVRRVVDAPSIGKFLTTVKLGRYKTVDALCAAIKASGEKKDVSNDAYQVLKNSVMSCVEVELDLYEVSNAELGFDRAVPRIETFKRALESGFVLISAEAMALARINVNDGKWRLAGMEPIADSGGGLRVLDLDLFSDGDLFWLSALYDSPGRLWRPDHVWVFARPRRK